MSKKRVLISKTSRCYTSSAKSYTQKIMSKTSSERSKCRKEYLSRTKASQTPSSPPAYIPPSPGNDSQTAPLCSNFFLFLFFFPIVLVFNVLAESRGYCAQTALLGIFLPPFFSSPFPSLLPAVHHHTKSTAIVEASLLSYIHIYIVEDRGSVHAICAMFRWNLSTREPIWRKKRAN